MVKYKTIALNRLSGKEGTKANDAIAPVAKVIESETLGGWEFVNMYEMPIDVKLGCIKSILNRSNDGGKNFFYMLVFKKED